MLVALLTHLNNLTGFNNLNQHRSILKYRHIFPAGFFYGTFFRLVLRIYMENEKIINSELLLQVCCEIA